MKTHTAVDHAILGSELYWMYHRTGELVSLFHDAYGPDHPAVEEPHHVKDALMALRNALADCSGDYDGSGHYFPGEEPPRNGPYL